MSDSEPDPPRGNAVDDPDERVAQRVEEFLRLTDEGTLVEPESFSAGLPEDIRSQVRQRCADILFVKRVLPWSGHASYRSDLAPGRQLGDFRMLRELGRGAMGVVYLARQVSLDRLVAVKVLPFAFSLSPHNVERFLRESHAAARLSHPSIVPVHAVGEQDGVRFFAMEYIQGRGLNEELEILRARRRDGLGPSKDDRLGTREGHSYSAQVAEICARVAEGLHHAHEQGVIHRDVKPHNILLDRQGIPFIVDFGLAKDLTEDSLTRTGEQPGTPFYMSPEQAIAKGARLDRRTDVFSLGVVMYEMLTLARPFTGKTHRDILEAITIRDPKPIREHNRDVPRDLQVICMKAMEKGRERRYTTAGAMAEDLRRFLGHESILARPPSLLEIGRRKLVRHRLAATVAATCVASLAVGFSWSTVQAGNARRDEALARLVGRLDGPALASLTVDQLHDQQLEIARVRREHEPLPQKDASALGALEERIAAVARDLAERGKRMRERGLALTPANGVVRFADFEVPSETELLNGLLLLRQASILLPNDEEIRRLADESVLLPSVSISADVAGALVSVRRFSDVWCIPDETRLIGPAPASEIKLAAGYWRVIVEVPGIGFAELTRYIAARGVDVPFAAHIRSTAEVTAQNMVLVPGGEFTFGDPSSPNTVNRMRTEHVDSFWIDRYEVSMAEYQAFLEATGRPAPFRWRRPYDASWARLPAAGVTFADAQAYAEWAGKRLPTQYEWSRAARGIEGFLFPWGNERDPMEQRARFARQSSRVSDMDAFVNAAQAVDSLPESAGPEGLLHMLDNVGEWTETIAWNLEGGQPALSPGSRVLLGCSMTSQPENASLTKYATLPLGGGALEFGFRCAKSVDP